MNLNDEYILKIEKMLYGGDGLSKLDGMPVFIKNVAPLDVVKAKITGIHKSYIEAESVKIEKNSEFRTEPVCKLSKICGSCDWQHISYKQQLIQKQNIIAETLTKIAGVNIDIDGILSSPKTLEYRCKVQIPFSQTKVSKRLLSGYYKKNSHELINIKYCPMQPKIICEINEFLKVEAQKIFISGYNEKEHKGLLRHIIYRISSDLTQILVVLVVNSNFVDRKLRNLANALINKYPQIAGVCVNFNIKRTNVIQGDKTENLIGNNYYIEKIGNKKFKVSSNSFFQVNPYCAEVIFNRVKEIIHERIEKPVILDAYSGVSSFGIWLSDEAKSVTCIEEVVSAYNDAKENAKINNITNIEIINGDAAKEFEKLYEQGKFFDISVTDPPRKGCSIQSVDYLSKLTNKYIIYVSCNPATLARDVKLFNERGFKLEYVQGADMFPNTYHIETIAVLSKI